MARFFVLIIGIALLSGCAQVGRLTGGDKDVYAPAPIEDKTTPPNRTANFSGKTVSFEFDEYIKLNNASQNIVMIPPHAKIKADVKGKKLTLSWEGDLQPNTTYSIYLNEAIQDITETNDSIFQYVFSTGSEIDSLEYTCFVVDAFTGEPKQGVIAAIFDADSNEILNFAETNSNGKATLSNIKMGDYSFVVFDDANRNLVYDKSEGVAFKEEGLIDIYGSEVDSIPYLYSVPKQEPQIRTFKYLDMGKFAVGLTSSISNEKIYLNGHQIGTDIIQKIKEDSLIIHGLSIISGLYELVIHSDQFKDTANLRINNAKTDLPISIKCATSFSPIDSVSLIFNSYVFSFSPPRVRVLNSADSSEIKEVEVNQYFDSLVFRFDRTNLSSVIIELDSAAIKCDYGFNNAYRTRVELNPERKYGTINFDLSAYENTPIYIQLLQGKKVVRSNLSKGVPSCSFKILEPGDYSVRVIHDYNLNQKWDCGNFAEKTQPERVDYYSKKIQLRANWEVDVPLVPTN